MWGARFASLAAGLTMETVAGSSYAFSIYGPQLKASLNLTQSDIDEVSSVLNVGSYLAFFGGAAYDALGPQWVAFTGAGAIALGYSLLWASATRRLTASVGMLDFACFTWAIGSSALDTAALATAISNFPTAKGLVLGLTKSLFGLSASILTLFYTTLYKPNAAQFILFCAIVIPSVAAIGASGVRLVNNAMTQLPLPQGQRVRLLLGYGGIVTLAAYLATVSLLVSRGTIAALPALAYVVPAALVATIAGVAVRADAEKPDPAAASVATGDASGGTVVGAAQPLLVLREAGAGDVAVPEGDAADAKDGATLVEGLLTLDFGVLFMCVLVGTGSGLTVINNLGSMSEAAGGAADSQDVFVTLLSIFNCGGRMLFGFASDVAGERLSRPGWLAICIGGMGLTMAYTAFATWPMLHATAMLSGLFYGGFWSLCPSMVAEVYGQRAMGSLVSAASLSTAIGSYLFSAKLSASVYAAHIPPGGGTVCQGAGCFRTTFLVLAGANAVATVGMLWLTRRLTGRVYVAHDANAAAADGAAPAAGPRRVGICGLGGRAILWAHHTGRGKRSIRPSPTWLRSLQAGCITCCPRPTAGGRRGCFGSCGLCLRRLVVADNDDDYGLAHAADASVNGALLGDGSDEEHSGLGVSLPRISTALKSGSGSSGAGGGGSGGGAS